MFRLSKNVAGFRIAATVFLALGLAIGASGVEPGSDERAIAIAREVLDALGGQPAWDGAHFVGFDFATIRDGKTVVIRSHWWDKYTGRHRVEGQTREGEPYVVLHNINTRKGRAWVNGKPVEGDELQTRLEGAWGAWVNDTYWLLMPYKMLDPGVTLKYDGEEGIESVMYDRLHLSFQGVGLTPGDQYWAWINRETHLMDRWQYLLQGQETKTAWSWGPWESYGSIKLARERHMVDGDRTLLLDRIAVLEEVPAAVFEELHAPRPTRMMVRAISRDAKIIGTKVGGAAITIKRVSDGHLLAEGKQLGGTGDTKAIMVEPRPRGVDVYDTAGAAGLLAHLWLDEPTVVEVIAEGPLGTPQSTQHASKTLLVVPGHDMVGDGVLLEIHGFTVQVESPAERSGYTTGETIHVRAKLTMT